MSGWIYFLIAAALWAGLAAHLTGLRRTWRDPLKRAFCTVIFLAGTSFALGASPVIAAINRATGVPNAAVPVAYGMVTAFSAASLVLVIQWRGGRPQHVRRVSRLWSVTYTLIIISEAVLFVLGDAGAERRTDFDTYYASTPFIREMIILYLVAHTAAAVTTTILCWRWTSQTNGWTGRSLKLLTVSWLCISCYGPAKLTALTLRWTGHASDGLSTQVAPLLVSVGAAGVTIGFILPLAGPALDTCLTLLRLRPLVQLLQPASSRWQFTVSLSWRSLADVELQLTRRTTAIRDGLSRLNPVLDDDVQQTAYARAIADGASDTTAQAIGSAAMIAVATQPGRQRARHTRVLLDPYQADLLLLAQAVRTPTVRAMIRAHAAASAKSPLSQDHPEMRADSDSKPPS
ncbi:MAB_1171c family putative transporter [Streptomyces sp. NPDC127038]|uniref:MAB_1171c family putative transporter n=1 Tax=Streptomyces sp. NPDC127038 TaxID=3347114 RepID=UPI0036634B20